MGRKAQDARRRTERRIRRTPLTDEERAFLLQNATYEGSPHHKRNPGDFGLTPPAAPRRDKTLCDEAGIFEKRFAEELFRRAVEQGLVSDDLVAPGFPKYLWVYDQERVFEAIKGGSKEGAYHGYPIRRTDPFFEDLVDTWNAR